MKKEGHIQLNAHIPQELHRELKRRAIDEDRSMADVLKDALTMYLSKAKKKKG